MKGAVPGIYGFLDRYEFLADYSLCEIPYQGILYPTLRHAFKAAEFSPGPVRIKIAKERKLSKVEKIVRDFERYDCWRPGWVEEHLGIMVDLNCRKFQRSPWRELLLATENLGLFNTNTWRDRYWGIYQGAGKNLLGEILMQIRADLQARFPDIAVAAIKEGIPEPVKGAIWAWTDDL